MAGTVGLPLLLWAMDRLGINPPSLLLWALVFLSVLTVILAVLTVRRIGSEPASPAYRHDRPTLDPRLQELEELIQHGLWLRAQVRDNEAWTGDRVWTECAEWHATAQAWIQRNAPRHADVYRRCPRVHECGQADDPIFRLVGIAVRYRVDALREIRRRIAARARRAA
jgi:hypothetical protein